jgi:NAD(P)-dependent dehydrogenase (short-subunit alcohol dehydrogenase family)
MRLKDKVAIVVGAGQTPGPTTGIGRASAISYAREGARVFAVDRNADSAGETVAMISGEGGEAQAWVGDATADTDVAAAVSACLTRWGRVDILHNNIGVSVGGGDGPIPEVSADAFDRLIALNLKTAFLSTTHVIPVMRAQEAGVITNISSLGSIINSPNVVYKMAKAALNAMTTQVAISNAHFGIRVNAILPGQVLTPMLTENRIGRNGMTREDIIDQFNAVVPLRNKMSTAWDIAKVAMFLASEDAGFITGVLLPVDGGQGLQTGGRAHMKS